MSRRASRAEAIATAVEVAAQPRGPVWIGIDGFGGAGKSALATAIAEAVPHARVVAIDDFSGPGIPEWDWARFRAEVVEPCDAAGVPAVLIVEGVSCTRAEAGVRWDLTIWVDTPDEVRLARIVERDGAAALPRWEDDWMPSERAYAARENPAGRVDLVVPGDE